MPGSIQEYVAPPNIERGHFYLRNLVLVEPDLAKPFPDSASVNAALRSVVEFVKLSASLTQRASGRAVKRRTV